MLGFGRGWEDSYQVWQSPKIQIMMCFPNLWDLLLLSSVGRVLVLPPFFFFLPPLNSAYVGNFTGESHMLTISSYKSPDKGW